ncbi:MAG: hypothetical protein LM580_05120 [Thermofilum sp.]|nr:hypothetical protein [Thermofilum sp.]MCC6065019.1 hypothetical protein [Thermofilum sp.]
MPMAGVMPVEEYERRILTKLLREAGVDPEPIVKRFLERRDSYSARLIERLASVDPSSAARAAQRLARSPNPLDKALAAWLAARAEERGPPPPLYV